MLINAGTVSVSNGSKTWNFTGSDLFDQGVQTGDLIQIIGQDAFYHIEVDPTNNLSAISLETYGGVTVTDVSYQILTGFLALNLTRIDPDQKDTYYAFNRNFEILTDEIAALGGTAVKTVVTPRWWPGDLVIDAEFGYLKYYNDAEIERIALSARAPAIEAVVLDMAIDGTWQGIDLTLAAGAAYIQSADLATIIASGEAITFRCTSGIASDIVVDIYWQNGSPSEVRYDFVRYWFGDLVVSGRIGKGYQPPVKSKVFGLAYNIQAPAVGQDIILELYLNNAATGTTATIPAGSQSGFLSVSQTQFETTEVCDVNINQVGVVPGSNLEITLYSYRVT